jgi:hypothetical protein
MFQTRTHARSGHWRRLLVLLLTIVPAAAILGAACAAGGQSGGRPTGRRDLITAEELQRVDVTNVYEAIREVRRWISRGVLGQRQGR